MNTPDSTSSEPWTCINTPSSAKLPDSAYKSLSGLSASGFLVSAPNLIKPYVNKSLSDYITITIGPKRIPMYIHSKLLRRKTRGYFEQVFGKGTLKLSPPESPCAHLPDDDWYTVGMFSLWTRRRSLTSSDKFVHKKETCSKEERLDILEKVFNLNLFSEKYQITELQDDALTLFIQLCREEDSPLKIAHIKKCYEHTAEKSKFREFLKALLFYVLSRPLETEAYNKMGWDLTEIINMDKTRKDTKLEEEVMGLMSIATGQFPDFPDPRNAPACEFHQHGKEEGCPYQEDDGFEIVEAIEAMEISEEEAIEKVKGNEVTGGAQIAKQ
ncbi:hypothetical protein NHQ30_004433 [Ciborinia camelliae]|nr:hypothetical protein NHQ30_004433 [Ciborinia camelliae]